jgi:hypothetical protein
MLASKRYPLRGLWGVIGTIAQCLDAASLDDPSSIPVGVRLETTALTGKPRTLAISRVSVLTLRTLLT